MMLSLALLGAAAVASAEPLAVRRLQSDSSCTGRHRSESETCEREFLANKGQGQGFRADCVGLAGSATEHCIYEPANLIDQCGLLAHQRPGDTPEEKCEAARGCAFEEGACVRNTKIPLSGMCAGNTHTSRDYQCPGLLVLKTQASAIQKPTSEDDLATTCCEHDMASLFDALDGNQNGKLTRTEAESPNAVSMGLSGDGIPLDVWQANDVNYDGVLSIDEFEVAYDGIMDVSSTPATRWLHTNCPEEMDVCNADATCYSTLRSVGGAASVSQALTAIADNSAAGGLVDVAECVQRTAKVDCEGEWSPCSAGCHKTYAVLMPQDEFGFGEACPVDHGHSEKCSPGTDGCHQVLDESIYSVHHVGADFRQTIPSFEWPDCKAGKAQQTFTYWVDVQPSQCLFDDGCCEDGSECPVMPPVKVDCPAPCVGEWSACDATLGRRQQLEYTVVQEAEEGGAPCEYDTGTIHMVDSCPSDCVGTCKCDPVSLEYGLFEVSPAYGGGMECPTDARVETHSECTDCVGHWEGECEHGEGAYQIETYIIDTKAVHGKPCPYANGQTRRLVCKQNCDGHWEHRCQSSRERITSLHELATACDNSAGSDYAGIAAATANDLPAWWPYESDDTWSAERGEHIAVSPEGDNEDSHEGTIPSIEACENMFAYLAGKKLSDDQGDAAPPCGFFFSIEDIPSDFACPVDCKAAVAQLVLHCDVYGLSEAHEGRACLDCDTPQDSFEGQFGGSQAVGVFTEYDVDASGGLSHDEVGEVCQRTQTEHSAMVLYCGPAPDGSDTWSPEAISEEISAMTDGSMGDVTREQFAAWWVTTDAFRWNPCPFQQHCSGTHYEVFFHTQTQVGDGDCCEARNGEVRPFDCPAVDCEGEWTGECIAPDEWATAETEALVTDLCAASELAHVPCSYDALPLDGSVQLQFYSHVTKAEQCGTSCMFSEGEHRPIRCQFECDPKWEVLEDDNCTQVYVVHYREGTGDFECPLDNEEGCEDASYQWNAAEQRCEVNTCGECPEGTHPCGDCCKPGTEYSNPCEPPPPAPEPGGPPPEPAPPIDRSVCSCQAPEPEEPVPEPEIAFDPVPPPPPPPPAPPPTIDEPAKSPECRAQEREVAHEDPDYFDPCDAPVPEPLVEVEYAQLVEVEVVPGLYSTTSRAESTEPERCFSNAEAPEPPTCLDQSVDVEEPAEEPEAEPEEVPEEEPEAPAPVFFHPICEVEEVEDPVFCTAVDCQGCWSTPCCDETCVEHEVYTYFQEASCGGKACDFPPGLTRPYACEMPCQGHWEGDCSDPETEYQEWVVDSGCGCIPAYCADPLTMAKVLEDGHEPTPASCEVMGNKWIEPVCGGSCQYGMDYDERTCTAEKGTWLTEAESEEACRTASLDAGLSLGADGYDFAGTYASEGCYYYTSGPFDGTAFWSDGDGALDGFKAPVPYTSCKVTVARPDYSSEVCEEGEVCQHAAFKPIRVRDCPRDCEGQWVGDCETTSQLTCSDLDELYGDSGWANVQTVSGRNVCAETDNLQANHFVDPGVMMIGGDDNQADIGASCRAMMTFVAALEVCECAGARLCTVEELEQDVTKGTGCNFDVARVWSSSRSRVETEDGDRVEMCDGENRWTAAGSSQYAERFPTKCRDITEELAVRCCADHEQYPTGDQTMRYQITQEPTKTGAACPYVDGDTMPLHCDSCGGEWLPECTIEDTEITQTFDATANGLPAKFGSDLTSSTLASMIDPSRLSKDPFCQCGPRVGHVTGDQRQFVCDVTKCEGEFFPRRATACSACDFVNDECEPDESCPSWMDCTNTNLPGGDDGNSETVVKEYVTYGTMTLADGTVVSNGVCSVTSIFVPAEGAHCSTAQLEVSHVTVCPHPIDCRGHWEGECEDFQSTHDRGEVTEDPTRTTPYQTFVVEQPAMNGGHLCLYEGSEVEDGATIGLDCTFKDCEGHWEGECTACGDEDERAEQIAAQLKDIKECSFCNAFDTDPQDWSADQCEDAYAQLVSSESPCGFRLGMDHVPDGPDDYLKCTDECRTLVAQFEGSCNLESLACVSIQTFQVDQEAILGEPCMSDTEPAYELTSDKSTRLIKCSQDCMGAWSNPHADGMCEKPGAYKTRIETVVADLSEGLCGGVTPIGEGELELTTPECQALMDELNGVDIDGPGPCGFKLAVDELPTDGTLCSPDCKLKVAQIQACAARDNMWAGAVQYEIYNLAREACNGGSTRTCSGGGATRRLACADSSCSYVPNNGEDWFDATNTVACGMNPPTRSCQGGYRFPVDAVATEWSDCDENGQQTRTCQTEAAFGGNTIDACRKDSSGAYKQQTKDCGNLAVGGGGDGGGGNDDMQETLLRLEQRISLYEAQLQAASTAAPFSASVAEAGAVESSLPLALAAGTAFGLVAVVGVVVATRGGGRKQSYKTLGEDSAAAGQPEEEIELAGVRASA